MQRNYLFNSEDPNIKAGLQALTGDTLEYVQRKYDDIVAKVNQHKKDLLVVIATSESDGEASVKLFNDIARKLASDIGEYCVAIIYKYKAETGVCNTEVYINFELSIANHNNLAKINHVFIENVFNNILDSLDNATTNARLNIKRDALLQLGVLKEPNKRPKSACIIF